MANINHSPTQHGILRTTALTDSITLQVRTGPHGQHALTYVVINEQQFGPYQNSFTQILGTVGHLINARVVVSTVVWDLVPGGKNETTWDMKLISGGNEFDPEPSKFENPNDMEGTSYEAVVYII